MCDNDIFIQVAAAQQVIKKHDLVDFDNNHLDHLWHARQRSYDYAQNNICSIVVSTISKYHWDWEVQNNENIAHLSYLNLLLPNACSKYRILPQKIYKLTQPVHLV